MKKPADDTGKIARSAGTVSIAVMCSRFLGLVREQVFATMFGAGFAFDAFVVAFRIPNLLRDLFGEGALSAAFVAVFSDYDTTRGEKATWRLANNVLVFFALFLSAVTLLGIFFSDSLVRFLVEADFEKVPGKTELTRLLTVIMFPFLVFISLSSVVMGVLNTKGRFFIPALASSFFNLGSIVAGVALALVLPKFGQPAIVGMAVGTLVGGLLQLGMQLPSLFRAGFAFKPSLDLSDPGLKRIFRLMLPAVVGLAPLQINVLVNTYFASSLEQGSLSWLNYAFRLFWFPVGMFGVAVSTAAMPVIARYAALRDFKSLRETFSSSLTMTFCLTIPASVGLVLLAEPIIRLIFEHGRFDAYSTVKTSEALTYYALGLFAYSAVKIMVPVFYALDDTKFPVIGSFLTMAANVLIIMVSLRALQHKALAFSVSCAMIGNFLFLFTILFRKLGGFSLSYILVGFLKIVAAALVMGCWLFGLRAGFTALLPAGLIWELGGLALLIGSSAALYGGMLILLRVQEATLLAGKIRARLAG